MAFSRAHPQGFLWYSGFLPFLFPWFWSINWLEMIAVLTCKLSCCWALAKLCCPGFFFFIYLFLVQLYAVIMWAWVLGVCGVDHKLSENTPLNATIIIIDIFVIMWLSLNPFNFAMLLTSPKGQCLQHTPFTYCAGSSDEFHHVTMTNVLALAMLCWKKWVYIWPDTSS